MNNEKDEDLVEKLKEAFSSALDTSEISSYPEEAMPLGTYARSIRHKKLGIITDAFYGDVDKDGKKIIVYTVLLLPEFNKFSRLSKTSEQYFLTNEYEYEMIGYLMMKPVAIKELAKTLGGNLFL
jgi:hypothetical protein